MKYMLIPHSECDYFCVLHEFRSTALISIKGFEFTIFNEPKFLKDIKTGNLHVVKLEIDVENKSLTYISHVSRDEYSQSSQNNILEDYLKTLNITLN